VFICYLPIYFKERYPEVCVATGTTGNKKFNNLEEIR